MRRALWIVWTVTLTLTAVAAHAQSGYFGGTTYYFSNAMGDGVLTLDDRNLPATAPGQGFPGQWIPVRATLWQNGQTISGSGVYPLRDPTVIRADNGFQPLAFTLDPPSGPAQVYQGGLVATYALLGQGTYWNAATPEQPATFRMSTSPMPINAQPQLSEGWTGKTFNEAFGGTYQATANGATGTMAVWTAQNVAPPGSTVELSVFLPRSATPGVLPRTAKAIYHVTPQSYATGRAIPLTPTDSQPVNQAVASSGWVVVGRFPADQGVAVTLTAATGEPAGSRSVVANAIRLRVVGP